MPDQAEIIRQLNDKLRTCHAGGHILVTQGVAALGAQFVADALRAVAAFDSFNEDNDPYGEHDFGAFALGGQRLFFKIDLYDPPLPSPENASNLVAAALIHRVLTVMLASEY